METTLCVACGRKCTISDSRPYPSSVTKDRMHNRCLLKAKFKPKPATVIAKASTDDTLKPSKQQDKPKEMLSTTTAPKVKSSVEENPKLFEPIDPPVVQSSVSFIRERVVEDPIKTAGMTSEEKVEKNKKCLEKILANEKQKQSAGNQFFFDLKAGIAKPHEKRAFLYHKKLQDMKVSYDDNCFKADSIGRSYDHRGKDLNNPSSSGSSNDGSDESDDELNYRSKSDRVINKRQKIENDDNSDNQTSSRGPAGKFRNKDSNINSSESHHRTQPREARNKQDNQEPCWFCLSSPKVEKHLIISIGDYCYLALAKGGLTDDHLLIIPIQHMRSTNDIDSKETLQEINKFKSSLVRFFTNQSKAVIFYERNFRSTHLQIQVVPFSLDLIDGIEKTIKTISEKFYPQISYQLIPNNCSVEEMIPRGQSYFLWEIEPLNVKFYSKIDTRGAFFPMQFGRKVLAHQDMLNLPDRIDWNKCCQSEEECKGLVKCLKEVYKPHDFTLN